MLVRDAVVAVMAAVVLAGTPVPASAQLGGIARKVKEKATQKVEAKEDKAAEKIVNAADPEAAAQAARSGEAGSATSSRSDEPKIWANYDFVPGVRTIFYTDFHDDGVGDFPRRLEFKTGGMEVIQLDGVPALKASSPSRLVIPLSDKLPERFTVEVDLINRTSRGVGAATMSLYGGRVVKEQDETATRVEYGAGSWGVSGGETATDASFTSEEAAEAAGRPVSVRLLADGSYLKLYVDGRRLANIPNAKFLRSNGLVLALEARDDDENAVYVTRIRVAESQRSIYDALSASGRWRTQGIRFATGSADIRAESEPTLKEIGAALQQHPDLRIRIEGHTDNVGDAASNQRLSQARAAAVRDRLMRQFQIDAGRIESTGLGDTTPLAPNTTAEGRADNRRVEIVKL